MLNDHLDEIGALSHLASLSLEENDVDALDHALGEISEVAQSLATWRRRIIGQGVRP